MAMKLGMLGMWHSHATGIVRQVAAHPEEFQLTAFWEGDEKLAGQKAEQWGKLLPEVKRYHSPAELLRQPLDGVVVEGRVYENVALARLALEAGFPVMLEKPAGTTMKDFQSLIDLAQRKHLRVQMIYLFRYMSAVLEMLKRGKQGELGDIYEFRARLPKDVSQYQAYVEELVRYPGGMFFEMAGHSIDMQVSLLGEPSKVTPFLGHHHRSPGKFVDHGIAMFEYERAWSIIEIPALEVVPHQRRIEVYGSRGACIIPHLGSGHLANKNVQPCEVFISGDKQWQHLEPPAAVLQIADLREFAATVAGKKDPDYSFEHDLIVHRALLEASGMLDG